MFMSWESWIAKAMASVMHVTSSLLPLPSFKTRSVALLIATKDATRSFCNFCILESCVLTRAGSWFQIRWFTRSVRSPSTFEGRGYLSIFDWIFSSANLSFKREVRIPARPSLIGEPVFSLTSKSWAMAKQRVRVWLFVSCATWASREAVSTPSISFAASSSSSKYDMFGAFYNKYLSRIDKFLNRAFKLGYTKVCYSVLNILSEKDRQLWEKIKSPDNPLHHLLPPTRDRVLRNRGHSFIIPRIRTERFKSVFIDRNLLSLR